MMRQKKDLLLYAMIVALGVCSLLLASRRTIDRKWEYYQLVHSADINRKTNAAAWLMKDPDDGRVIELFESHPPLLVRKAIVRAWRLSADFIPPANLTGTLVEETDDEVLEEALSGIEAYLAVHDDLIGGLVVGTFYPTTPAPIARRCAELLQDVSFGTFQYNQNMTKQELKEAARAWMRRHRKRDVPVQE